MATRRSIIEMTRQALLVVDAQLTSLSELYTSYHIHDVHAEINMIYNSIVDALNYCADSCIPRL